MIVVPTTRETAADWCARLHYTGTAAGTRFFLAIDFGRPVAVICLGRGGNRFGVGDKFGLREWRGDLEITRVVCDPKASRNTASAAIAAVCRVLAAEGVDWLFSYSDTAQNHHGGIYQAVNAVYVGTDARQWVCFALNGKRVSKRLVSGRYGHTRWPEVQALAAARGDVLEKVSWAPKLTYILPISRNRRVQKAIRRALTSRALPYPKRGEAVTPTPYRNKA